MLLPVRTPCCREHISAVPQERPRTCTTEKMREFGVDATEMKIVVLHAKALLDSMQGKESEKC